MLLFRRLVPAALLVLVALLGFDARPAGAQFGESIERYLIDLTVEPSGSLLVRETITYDFGPNERRGILREIPVRYQYEPDPDFDRMLRLDVLDVSTDTDAPDQYEVEDPGNDRRIRIGDPDVFITGTHTYVIDYRIEGALNGFDDHDELFWNAIGPQWEVPISGAEVTVSAPSDITQTACYTGPFESRLPCSDSTEASQEAIFVEDGLAPYEALSVVVGFEPGAVASTAPILEERWSFDSAFARTATTVGLSSALLVALVGGVGALAWRFGRDRRYVGSATDVAFGNEGGATERVPMSGGDDLIPVEFVPPDNVRPGEVGTLIDETAHPLDVVATIIDLAVRGYLRIEEIPKEGWFGKPDWTLHRLKPGDDLQPYEQLLLDGLFEDGPEVNLSDLKNTFATRLKSVQDALYDETVSEGWFRTRPDRTRSAWVALGVLLTLVGIGLTVAVAAFTSFGLVPVPIAVGGIVLLVCSRRFPRRTAKGTGTLRRVLGFKRFIDESEADRARFAERQHLFSEYLPYAVVFGVTEKWAKAFAGIDGELPQQGWYVGYHPFTTFAFIGAMDGFATTTAGTMSSVPASSGSSGFSSGGGFSGGGMGGGGGGSW